MRWSADVDVWTSGGAGNSRAKRKIRNCVSLQKIQQRLTFGAVWMKLYVHGVAMVQAPAIVNRTLTKNRDRKLAMKRVLKEALNFVSLAEVPARTAGETNIRRGANESLLGETQVLGDLLVGGLLHQHGRDLIVGAGHLAADFSDLGFRRVERLLIFFDVFFGDQLLGEQLLRD